jgi:hypothetical protein
MTEEKEIVEVRHVVPEVVPMRVGSSRGVSSLERVPVVGEGADRGAYVLSADVHGEVVRERVSGGVDKSTSALSDLNGRSASLRDVAGREATRIVDGAGTKTGRDALVNTGVKAQALSIEKHSVQSDDPSVPSLRADGFLCWFDQPEKVREKVASALRKARKSIDLRSSSNATSYAQNEILISDSMSGMLINTIAQNKGAYFQCGVFGEQCIVALYGSKQFFRFGVKVLERLAAARFVNVEFVNASSIDKDIYEAKLAKAGVGKMKDHASSAKNLATSRLNKVEAVQDAVVRRMDRKRLQGTPQEMMALENYCPPVNVLAAFCDMALMHNSDKVGHHVDHMLIAKSAIIWMNDGPVEQMRELLYENARQAIQRLSEGGGFTAVLSMLERCLERAYHHRHHGLLDLFEDVDNYSTFEACAAEGGLTDTLIEVLKEHKVYAKQGHLDYPVKGKGEEEGDDSQEDLAD